MQHKCISFLQELLLLVEAMMEGGLFGKKDQEDWLKCLLEMRLVKVSTLFILWVYFVLCVLFHPFLTLSSFCG